MKMPKLHEKEIIRLDPDEVATLLDAVENGEHMTKSELKYHAKTKDRDQPNRYHPFPDKE